MKKLIEWLYVRYVLLPEIRKHYGDDAEILSVEVTGTRSVDVESAQAQLYKDIARPEIH